MKFWANMSKAGKITLVSVVAVCVIVPAIVLPIVLRRSGAYRLSSITLATEHSSATITRGQSVNIFSMLDDFLTPMIPVIVDALRDEDVQNEAQVIIEEFVGPLFMAVQSIAGDLYSAGKITGVQRDLLQDHVNLILGTGSMASETLIGSEYWNLGQIGENGTGVFGILQDAAPLLAPAIIDVFVVNADVVDDEGNPIPPQILDTDGTTLIPNPAFVVARPAVVQAAFDAFLVDVFGEDHEPNAIDDLEFLELISWVFGTPVTEAQFNLLVTKIEMILAADYENFNVDQLARMLNNLIAPATGFDLNDIGGVFNDMFSILQPVGIRLNGDRFIVDGVPQLLRNLGVDDAIVGIIDSPLGASILNMRYIVEYGRYLRIQTNHFTPGAYADIGTVVPGLVTGLLPSDSDIPVQPLVRILESEGLEIALIHENRSLTARINVNISAIIADVLAILNAMLENESDVAIVSVLTPLINAITGIGPMNLSVSLGFTR